MPQTVESKTNLGSRLSAHTTPSFPKAMPLGHLLSAVAMSWISSTKVLLDQGTCNIGFIVCTGPVVMADL